MKFNLTNDPIIDDDSGMPGYDEGPKDRVKRMLDPASFSYDMIPEDALAKIIEETDTTDIVPGAPFTPEELAYIPPQQDPVKFDHTNSTYEDPIMKAGAFEGDIKFS